MYIIEPFILLIGTIRNPMDRLYISTPRLNVMGGKRAFVGRFIVVCTLFGVCASERVWLGKPAVSAEGIP